MEKKGPQVNHLSFTDDVIIFSYTIRFSVHLIMKMLHNYEESSCQLENKDKSHFIILENAPT